MSDAKVAGRRSQRVARRAVRPIAIAAVSAVVAIGLLAAAPAAVKLSAAGTDPNAYFNSLVTRSDLWQAYSLRDQTQVLSLRESTSLPGDVNYVYPDDPDPRAQDAAKVVMPADSVSIRNQLRIPMNTEPGHIYLVTWDYWVGQEWAYGHTGIANTKQFQFGTPQNAWWLQTNAHWASAAPGTIALIDIRGWNWDPATMTPPVLRYLYAERWTRVWWLLDTRPDGYIHASLWFADEDQDPVQLVSNVSVVYAGAIPSIGQWWTEYNTSAHTWDIPAGRGPLVGYVRNVVMLKDFDPSQISSLLVRPIGDGRSRPLAPSNVHLIG